MLKHLLILCVLCVLSTAAQAAPAAFVTVAPQKFFVDKISGGLIPVSVMVQSGANPHAYEPKPKQMAELAKAKIYFTIGDTFDSTWLERIKGASPGITIVHTEDGVEKIAMGEAHEGEDHAHESEHHEHDAKEHKKGHAEEHHHDHGGLDPHIWLDPALVKIQAKNIAHGLSKVDPENAATYAANLAKFNQELDALDAEIRTALAPLPAGKRTFLVFHPSWGYFAKTYGLTQAAIEVEGKEPSPKEMAAIIKLGKESKTQVVFVQPQFSEKSAAVIAKQIGANISRLDPLSPDWANNLRLAAKAIAEALK